MVRPLAVLLLLIGLVLPAAAEPTYTLKAQDRPIGDFLREVSSITGKNLLVDPSVTGTVTLISPHPLTREEVWNVTLSALDLNGFAAVEFGSIVKIVPKDKAATQPVPVRSPSGPADPAAGAEASDAFASDIIELRYMQASDAVAQTQSLLSPDERISSLPSRNAVVLVASAANIARVRELLSRLDVEGASPSVEIFRLQYASSSKVAALLIELFDKAGGVSGQGCRCVFTTEPRTNALIVRAPSDERRAAAKLVEMLDKTDAAVEIARLRNMDAEQAREALQALTASP